MPFGGLLSLAAPALSIGSSLFGMSQGTPASNVQGYNYNYRPQADAGAYNAIMGLGGLAGQGSNLASNVQNNPYASSYVNNAAGIGSNMMQTGQGQVGTGNTLTSSSLSMLPDVQSLLSLGFDPQNALYSQLQNQNQQQNAAILGQSGVASTPYGAGVAANANSNFNINWQNQQLQRALQGAQGASGLLGSIGSGATTGAGLQQQGLGLQQQGAALPYSAYNATNTDALGALSQASGIGQTAANDWLAYLSGGTNQQGQNLSQANSSFSQSQALGQGLGQGIAGLSTGWNNAFNPAYGGNGVWGGSSSNPLPGLSASDYGAGF